MDNNAAMPTHNIVNTSKEAEMSISPTLIVPLLTDDGRYFRVKTLLDSGSGTNWITRKVLEQVKHKIKGHNILQVYTFGNVLQQRFTLVEIYVHNDQGKTIPIVCYMQEQYTAHVAVQGMLSHIMFNHTTPFSFSKPLIDPNLVEVDHSDEANSIGLILCSATINSLRTNEPIVLLPELKILLEPTIFGVAISGKVPKSLKSKPLPAAARNITIKFVNNFSQEKPLAKETNSLQKQENSCRTPKEQSLGDLKAWHVGTQRESLPAPKLQMSPRLSKSHQTSKLSNSKKSTNIPKSQNNSCSVSKVSEPTMDLSSDPPNQYQTNVVQLFKALKHKWPNELDHFQSVCHLGKLQNEPSKYSENVIP